MPVMSRPTMRACMVSVPSKVWMASARLHRFADIRDTRNRRANSRSLAPASIRSAAASRMPLPGRPHRRLTTGVRDGAGRHPAIRAFREALRQAVREARGTP